MSHTVSVSSLCVLGGSYFEAAEDDLLVRPLFALVHVAYDYPKQAHLPAVITLFLPTGFSRVSARKTRKPEPSWPDLTRARHIK